MNRRCALYCRVSTNLQDCGPQEQELREVAAQAGWDVVEVYKEQRHLEFLLNIPTRLDRYGAFARGRDQEMIAVEYYAPRNRCAGRSNDPMEIV
jgi:hypothetical protein